MTDKMSKSERILALLTLGPSTSDVASIVGCNSAYVRVVRQRAASPDGLTPSDRRFRATPEFKAGRSAYVMRRYHSEPEFRQKHLNASKRAYATRKIRARIREASNASS
jgi:hypothetical protein